MRRSFFPFVLVLAGSQLAQLDCGLGNQQSGQSLLGAVCTATLACADSPCTPGCTFVLANDFGCPVAAPEAIAKMYVDACTQSCGGGASGYCYRLDASQAKCRQPPPCGSSYPPSCYEVGETFVENELVICQAGESCYDGEPGLACDLSVPDVPGANDLATID
jgi:hypothetical protein